MRFIVGPARFAWLAVRGGTTVGVTVALVLGTVPGPAAAATALASGGGVLRSAVVDSHAVTSPHPYWSVVATHGYLGGQPDLTLRDQNGAFLAESTEPFSTADWVAFDNNAGRLPRGQYLAEVRAATDHGRPTTHLVQFVAGDKTLSPLLPETVIGFANNPWMVDIRDVYLGTGQTLTLTVKGLSNINMVHLVQSTSDRQTWSRRRAHAARSVELPKEDFPGQSYSVSYTASTSGYHGVIFESRRWGQWVQAQTGGVGSVTVAVS